MEFRIFGITFRLSWSFGVDSGSQAQAVISALPPIPVPFLVTPNGTEKALAIMGEHPIAALKTAYAQSLTIARQMLRDGTSREDASGFTALCLGLDILGSKLPFDDIPKDHASAFLPAKVTYRRPSDDGDTAPPLPPKKPRKRGRGNDRD